MILDTFIWVGLYFFSPIRRRVQQTHIWRMKGEMKMISKLESKTGTKTVISTRCTCGCGCDPETVEKDVL